MTPKLFDALTTELSKRSASALLGALGPVSAPLRHHLRDRLEVAAGEEGGLLGDPVFEAMFDWQMSPQTMEDLAAAGMLSPLTVKAMATASADPDLREYIFPADRRPYTHQFESWQQLTRDEARSVLVSSGTGSGKTECFLVPILDRLAREQQKSGLITGVQALFLYPLNALINSQRDRLRAWCEPFGGKIRFSLYKGDTPDSLPARQRRARAEEVSDRASLRDDPPPILVTNSTMLEYMLIRSEDRPIISASRGKLRWIVLDEAHTYLGSHAAETALLLRRVLHAFDVAPEYVRFVATSATIGDGGEESKEALRQFLADLAGVEPAQVSVVMGKRSLPQLPDAFHNRDEPLPELDVLRQQDPMARFHTLASNHSARLMRQALLDNQALTGSALTAIRLGVHGPAPGETCTADERLQTVELIDLCATAGSAEQPFLRTRMHLFHRTHGGIWACINPRCSGRSETALDAKDWEFGKVFFERRERCEACSAVVFTVVLCGECGADYLGADLTSAEGVHRYVPRLPEDVREADEYAELIEIEEEQEETAPEPDRWARLLTRAGTPDSQVVCIRLSDGVIDGEGDTVELGELASRVAGSPEIRCTRCGRVERYRGEVFRETRRGAPFFLRSTIPILLDHTPAAQRKDRRLPARGRRLITFTDSRQGTARFALDAQLDSERNYIRSFVYHQVAARRRDQETARGDEAALIAQIEEMKRLGATSNPALRPLLVNLEHQLAQLRTPVVGRIAWSELTGLLAQQDEVRSWMHDHWRNLPLSDLGAHDVAHFCLLREFMRRPKRQNSLETLGLVSLRYPKLNGGTVNPPAVWLQRQLPAREWLNFLRIGLDFFVRAYSAVDVDDRFLHWMGAPVRPKVLVGPDAEPSSWKQVRWPTVNPRNRRNRLIQLLARVLKVSPADADGAADIDACLRHAWPQLLPLLAQRQEGRVFSFFEDAELQEGREAWLCPVTRRILGVTLCGYTPYVTEHLPDAAATCQPVQLPTLPEGFWQRADGSTYTRDEIEEWMRESAEIRELEAEGVWSDLSSRIAARTDYFQVGEHSAQQSAPRLQELEREFREGKLNLLSCSTTMELGVDIGGLSAVAMNNTPPSPANYLQRAGRAGRRKETRAFSFTLCKNTPQGEWVFRSPLWPFTTPIHVPEVTLGSDRIVQRHLNSLALTRFFEVVASATELRKLHAGAFFEPREEGLTSVCEKFEEWLLHEAPNDAWLAEGVNKLVRRSVREGAGLVRVLSAAAEAIEGVRVAWLAELEPLTRQLQELGTDTQDEIVKKALQYRLIRIRDEYLLKELALRNFLPGHGFPTHVVPFVTTTAEDLRRRRNRAEQNAARIDNLAISQGYPSRELTIALRDYAPGSTVVVDGRVLESRGVTLNWKIPATDAQVREVQALKYAWRCQRCGNTGVSSSWPGGCMSEICAGADTHVDRQSYLEPSGFSVGISDSATNDLTRNTYLPVEDPWISTGSEPWQSLPRPELGRYRYSGSGRLFAYSRGQFGKGYAICLRCGRAASEGDNPSTLPETLKEHRPLRGGSDRDEHGRCRGNEHSWSIIRTTWLGVAKETDVFELQLRYADSGDTVASDTAAASLAVALRQALAEFIGVEDREIGWASIPSRISETGEQTRSMVLYDTATGGAGFVAQAVTNLPALLRRASRILECPRGCDAACHACLLSSDTWHSAPRLNRHQALTVLTASFRSGLELPEGSQIFGTETSVEFEPLLAAISRELRSPASGSVRLVLAGSPQQWELEEWHVAQRFGRWMSEGIMIDLLVPTDVLSDLDESSRNRLAAWSDAGLARIVEIEPDQHRIGDGFLIAEVGGAEHRARFGVLAADETTPDAEWGIGESGARVVRVRSADPLPALEEVGDVRPGETLRVSPAGAMAALSIWNELHGDIGSFGERFWNTILPAVPELVKRLESSAPITEVTYADRYVRTPLVMRAVIAVLKSLRGRAKSVMAESTIRLETVPIGGYGKIGYAVWENWDPGADLQTIFATAAAHSGFQGELVTVPKNKSLHARELRIDWQDGTRWAIRLDEGFGFVKSASHVKHDFHASAAQQGAALVHASYQVESWHSTYIYALKVRPAVGSDGGV